MSDLYKIPLKSDGPCIFNFDERLIFVLREPLGSSHVPTEEELDDYAKKIVTAVNSHRALLDAGTAFHEATERLLDWMNGNDLSADHAEQKPSDFEELSSSLRAFRDALLLARGESQ